MRLLTAALASLICSNLVMAEEAPGSEYFHQAGNGTLELLAGLGGEPGRFAWTNGAPDSMQFSTTNLRNSDLKFVSALFPASATAEYGLSSMLAVGVNLIYGSEGTAISNCENCTDSSFTEKGLYNPALYLKGHFALGSAGALVYGLVVDVGLEKNKVDSSGNGNLATGGTTVTPYVGYEIGVGPGHVGARVQYDVYKGDRKQHNDMSQTQDTTGTGGNNYAVDAFYEIVLGKATLGASAYFKHGSETKTSSLSDGDANDGLGVQVYVPIRFSELFSLIPTASYQYVGYYQTPQSPSGTRQMTGGVGVGVAARFAF